MYPNYPCLLVSPSLDHLSREPGLWYHASYSTQMPLLAFLQQVHVELAKVVWPSRQETINLTVLVIAVSLVVGFFIGGLDLILTNGLELIIRK